MEWLAVVLDVVILTAIYTAVARDDSAKRRTATAEMWDRPLSWWTQHLNDECRAGLLAEIPDTGIRKPSRGSI